MPKLRAVGTNLGLFSRVASKASAGLRKKIQAVSRPSFVEPLEDRLLLSTSYYVATWGSDGSNGSVSAPFKSIQRAAGTANWGDSVQIEGGTYHETVTPAHSGVTFQNYNGQSVTVDGADQVWNFSSYGNGIYSTQLGFNLGQGNNQVFVDGQLMNDARWPNSGTDISHPSQAQIAIDFGQHDLQFEFESAVRILGGRDDAHYAGRGLDELQLVCEQLGAGLGERVLAELEPV